MEEIICVVQRLDRPKRSRVPQTKQSVEAPGISVRMASAIVQNLRNVTTSFGQQNKPLFDTEGSWGAENGVPAITDPQHRRLSLRAINRNRWGPA